MRGPAGGPGRGEAGEDLACAHLVRQGLSVLARNYRCRAGEIDVVARRPGDASSSSRSRSGAATPTARAVEAVTPEKRRRIVRAAQRLRGDARPRPTGPVRFDVVAIDWGPDGPRVRHDAGAFGER